VEFSAHIKHCASYRIDAPAYQKMEFLGQAVKKLEHEQDSQTNRGSERKKEKEIRRITT